MFNGHTVSVVTNLNMIGPEINDGNYIRIAAITGDAYPPIPTIFNAGILMPPTEILMAWADGDPYVLQREYPKYLMSKEPDEVIVAILAALTKRNIILYIPEDEFKIFGSILLNHLQFIYGITCNTGISLFNIDATKIPYIISKFYLMDLMDMDDYIALYPATIPLPEPVIFKMSQDRPMPNATFVDYVAYFNNLNRSKGINSPKVNMVNIVTKEV